MLSSVDSSFWVLFFYSFIHLPADCRAATTLPAATPPPLATAAADIIFAATDPAAIPAEVNPATPRTTGAATTAPAAQQRQLSWLVVAQGHFKLNWQRWRIRASVQNLARVHPVRDRWQVLHPNISSECAGLVTVKRLTCTCHHCKTSNYKDTKRSQVILCLSVQVTNTGNMSTNRFYKITQQHQSLWQHLPGSILSFALTVSDDADCLCRLLWRGRCSERMSLHNPVPQNRFWGNETVITGLDARGRQYAYCWSRPVVLFGLYRLWVTCGKLWVRSLHSPSTPGHLVSQPFICAWSHVLAPVPEV